MSTKTADQLREEADRNDQLAEESWQRSDTDGFLSQWSLGLTANQKRAQATIEDNGGVSEFRALFTLDGQRVRAKLIDAKYGTTWAFADENDEFTGVFVKAFPARESTMTKKGLVEGWEEAPAKAVLKSNGGTGLSGNVWVATVRLDKGYPDDAVVVERTW